MKTWALGEVCTHGSLGRSCPICERDEEITELTKQRDRYVTALKAIAAIRKNHSFYALGRDAQGIARDALSDFGEWVIK